MKIDSKAHQTGSHLNFLRETHDQIIHCHACSPENLSRYLDLLVFLHHLPNMINVDLLFSKTTS